MVRKSSSDWLLSAKKAHGLSTFLERLLSTTSPLCSTNESLTTIGGHELLYYDILGNFMALKGIIGQCRVL